MSLSTKIREQIINSFRTELAEHVQTMNQGLLALEQKSVSGTQREEELGEVLRAAHSLKGAARAVGVSAIEQLAHALEDVLGGLQQGNLDEGSALFTACFHAVDAIQTVQAAYEAGEISPPPESLQALAELSKFQKAMTSSAASSKASKDKKETLPNRPQSDEPASRRSTRRTSSSTRKRSTRSSRAKKPPQNALEETNEMQTSAAPSSSGEQKPTSTPAKGGKATGNAKTPVSVDETIRVSVGKLDALMAQLSELLITKIHAEQRMAQVRQAQAYVTDWQKDWLSVRSAYGHLARRRNGKGSQQEDENDFDSIERRELNYLLDYMHTSQERLREMNVLINDLSRQYSSDTMQMSLVIDGLEEEIKRVRMLPLYTITGAFGRMIRDLAQASEKDIRFDVIGGDVELDKRVLEQIKDPLIHLLRNAVDHAIETPEQRLAAGKPSYGTVKLEARQIGKDVSISVSDDGVGLKIDAIRQAAIRRNIPNAQTMTDAELADLIYNAGFSTSPIITDISGRGVGLDVVRRNVETLGGRINIDWQEEAGTCFTLLLPLALTSSRALLINVSGQKFAIPLNAIERIEHVQPDDILSAGGHETLQYNDRPLMLAHLGDVLGLPPMHQPDTGERLPVVILASAERRTAFVVDKLNDEQEVVMKGLGKQLSRVGGIAGASVMGNGEVLMILNAADLIKLAQRGSKRSVLETVTPTTDVTNEPLQRQILVVDDSITTRTLEKNILEAAGFNVHIAMDGLEALDRINSSQQLPDLIISDVAMPRLDGLGLAEHIKGDQRTAHIPFILVTSLDSTEDKARGVEVGADAYIVKSSFDQHNLLETIEQLI